MQCWTDCTPVPLVQEHIGGGSHVFLRGYSGDSAKSVCASSPADDCVVRRVGTPAAKAGWPPPGPLQGPTLVDTDIPVLENLWARASSRSCGAPGSHSSALGRLPPRAPAGASATGRSAATSGPPTGPPGKPPSASGAEQFAAESRAAAEPTAAKSHNPVAPLAAAPCGADVGGAGEEAGEADSAPGSGTARTCTAPLPSATASRPSLSFARQSLG